ncbi:MAG: GNAT family N-acetyltransferase [Armatimonadota bacterium]|jgi:CelD/BcsL family acetyltransferase involved in cellulose biosynthesis
MSLTTKVIDTIAGMREIRTAYDEIAAACDAPPFVSWDWLYRWWETAAQGYRIEILTFWAGSELQGALPLMQVKYGLRRGMMRELRFASDCVVASPTYMDLLARPGAESACLGSAFEHLAADPGWDRMELCRLRADSPSISLLCRAAVEHGFRAEIRPYVSCPYANLPATFDEYLSGLSSNRRKKTKYERRQLSRNHATRFVRCTDADAIDALLEKHFSWKAERMQRLGKWTQYTDPAFRRFTRSVAHDFQDRGWLRLWYLEVDGEPAAIEHVIVANSTCYLKSHSYDERWMKQRIADVSLGFCIESVIEEGVRVLDFLSTPAAEKFHYARHVAQVLKLTLYRPRLRSLCFEALAHVGALPMASLKHLRTGRASAPEPAPAAATES